MWRAFSADGSVPASGGEKSVELWDARTGELHNQLSGHTDAVMSVAFSLDGTTLASGGHDGMRLWDARTGEQIHRPGSGTSRALSLDPPCK